jgi:hypothetical protein
MSTYGGRSRIGELQNIPSQSTLIEDVSRPNEFFKCSTYEDSEDEESRIGKMPPSDSEDE